MLLVTLTLVAILVATLWLYGKHRHSYWAKRGIPSPPVTPILGNLPDITSNQGRWVFDKEAYCKYSKDGVSGIYLFLTPVLLLGNPELIRLIFVKDFDHFTDRQVLKSPHPKDKILDGMLSNENGEEWKLLRYIMTPTFTSGKMKNMFHLVSKKADDLVAFTLAETKKKPFVDMKYNFGRFTIDTIASCAFGIECNSLGDEDAIFPRKADPFFKIGAMRAVKFFTVALMPKLFGLLGLRLFPDELKFFQEVAEETLAARRKGEKRGDFLDLLLEAQASEESSSDRKVMDNDHLIAQCVLFIIAGYDTTATTLAFASYLLAKHPDAQHRLRQELQESIVEHNGLTYQGVMESKYLDGCILETLRLYPPAPMLERKCSKEYQVPKLNITIRKGDLVQLPVWAIHHDEKYWPEPEAFKPERFLPENKENIVHYTHMPFGLGPRNCIAMRFALMEAKVGLAKMVLRTEMKLAPGHEEIVLSSSAGAFLMKPESVQMVFETLNEE